MPSCPICVENLRSNAQIECQACSFVCCTSCQKTYNKPVCMSCGKLPSRAAFLKAVGLKGTTQVYDPFILQEVFQKETDILPSFQTYVNWEKMRRAIKARYRFGERATIPPAPEIPQIQTYSIGFGCSKQPTCRGYVHGGMCGLCKTPHCNRCRLIITEGHVCDEELVQSILFIQQDTKPCPRCAVPIHKTSGCDHMVCTECGVYFSWINGTLMTNTTNGHYNPINHRMNIRRQEATTTGFEVCELEEGDLIPDDVLRAALDLHEDNEAWKPIEQQIYKDLEDMELFQHDLFDMENLSQKYFEELQKARVKFMLEEYSVAQWKSRIKTLYMGHQRAIAIAEALHLHIMTLKTIQRLLYNKTLPTNELGTALDNLHAMTEQAMDNIKANYGKCTVPVLRPRSAPFNHPVIALG